MKKVINILLALLVSFPGFSQEVEMADTLRSNGKIYVLMSIILVILVGLAAYLVVIDRKACRLEKRLNENKH